jgi:hypothetical protein
VSCNATSSLVCFENTKKIFYYIEKRSTYVVCYNNAGVVVVKSEVVGWGPGITITIFQENVSADIPRSYVH